MDGQLFHLQIDGQTEGGRNRKQIDVQMDGQLFYLQIDGQMDGQMEGKNGKKIDVQMMDKKVYSHQSNS